LLGPALDDRGPLALEAAYRQTNEKNWPGRVSFRGWHADPYRGGLEETCLAAFGARPRGADFLGSGRARGLDCRLGRLSIRFDARESHAQTRPDRSTYFQRDRQRLFR